MKTNKLKTNGPVNENIHLNKRFPVDQTETDCGKGYKDCATKLINTMFQRLDITKKDVIDHGGDKNMISAIKDYSLRLSHLSNELHETPSCISAFDYRIRLSKCIVLGHYMIIGINAIVSEAN